MPSIRQHNRNLPSQLLHQSFRKCLSFKPIHEGKVRSRGSPRLRGPVSALGSRPDLGLAREMLASPGQSNCEAGKPLFHLIQTISYVLVTSASLLVTSALLVVTRFAIRNNKLLVTSKHGHEEAETLVMMGAPQLEMLDAATFWWSISKRGSVTHHFPASYSSWVKTRWPNKRESRVEITCRSFKDLCRGNLCFETK